MKRARRAIIIAKGEVQGVGYRGIVFKIARKLNLVGYVVKELTQMKRAVPLRIAHPATKRKKKSV